ncbi:hypothetical protein AKJ52_01455 [candidate division MSBL1 archaeon SCGC-AAA382C18]|uniref:DUF4914 domain-containing protein n=1 Tax=candidate division MSBL1 archaeon SCGC-AAA382C18 TaxID=1698281 RepID=A0A133VK90_9EURY|nr:hypothetical protein AKJ52_01455 [candidate division MSBL1 archaeon SCGC-AAA382C18]
MDKYFNLNEAAEQTLKNAPSVTLGQTAKELRELAVPGDPDEWYEVSYKVNNKEVLEAKVCRVKNGIAVNYPEPYMRRRDPDAMLIGDDMPTDKRRYEDEFEGDFESVRKETYNWLMERELLVFPFMAGHENCEIPSIAIAPGNAGFFALGLGLLQGISDIERMDHPVKPKLYINVAPPFRHTHFDGKQRVVHNRTETQHEIFSYNLYPGPSAKKGVYGALLHFGRMEGWVTTHASTVKTRTPYNMKSVFMHEGASGGGKSEMNERIHQEEDGSIHLGHNIVTGEDKRLVISQFNKFMPGADDMVLCHKNLQKDNGKLTTRDAENAWFIRVDHIENYGTDPDIESRTISPGRPLEFFNIHTQPNSTALLWEHVEDEPGVPCPNPRFILPREIVPNIRNNPLDIDIRSFGIRTPPCTKEEPNYGILGMFHVLPPALAWLWRLVSPRGHGNPSIVETEGIQAEGVGSYWPFATGKKVDHANLLLEQFMNSPDILNVLTPNQHVGAWEVGFMPEWLMREYLPRRGGKLEASELTPARCSLLGYNLDELIIEGHEISKYMLDVSRQREVGKEAYDEGAEILTSFFKEEVKKFLTDRLHPTGREIIETFLDDGSVKDIEEIIENNDILPYLIGD